MTLTLNWNRKSGTVWYQMLLIKTLFTPPSLLSLPPQTFLTSPSGN